MHDSLHLQLGCNEKIENIEYISDDGRSGSLREAFFTAQNVYVEYSSTSSTYGTHLPYTSLFYPVHIIFSSVFQSLFSSLSLQSFICFLLSLCRSACSTTPRCLSGRVQRAQAVCLDATAGMGLRQVRFLLQIRCVCKCMPGAG